MAVSANTTAPIITCRRVFMAYGRQEVLRDVSIEIPAGVFLPFVGPNGAGKTTLLRLILGLLDPVEGRIETPFKHKAAGYLPQQKTIDPLYPVTTRQIVEMGLFPEIGWRRRPDEKQKRRVDDILGRFGLREHQRKTFDELSGGIRQKALLARALVSGADVFVMDEPTSELDEASEQDVLRHLVGLARDEGKTVLLAHHGLDQAAVLAETVCVVNHGRATITSVERARRLLAGTSSVGRA